MASKIFVPRDLDIRQALRRRLTALHPDALVLDELAMKHGDFRVDLAVIGDRLHGLAYDPHINEDRTLPRAHRKDYLWGYVDGFRNSGSYYVGGK